MGQSRDVNEGDYLCVRFEMTTRQNRFVLRDDPEAEVALLHGTYIMETTTNNVFTIILEGTNLKILFSDARKSTLPLSGISTLATFRVISLPTIRRTKEAVAA